MRFPLPRLLFLASALCLALALSAQTPTATLVGRVEDASGAVIPGAHIEARNTATNERRAATSGSGGEFTIPNLAPGVYDVAVEKPGFRRLEQTGLQLQVDQAARLSLRLQVGALSERVEVTAATPLLNTENGSKGDVISSRELVEMPLEGRDFGDLAYLVAGVSPKAESGQGSDFTANGARTDNTNFVIDGFNNQDPRSGGSQASPPIDSMQEFKMQTNGYSAEYGRLAGGVMNMVLKSGANQPHGTLFEFVRNDKLDARNFFVAEKSKLRRNQFGGTFSGPVWIPKLYQGRDRTFFLVSWESQRQIAGVTRLGRVPTEMERQGDFSQTLDVSGNVIPLHDPFAAGTCTAAVRAACFPNNKIPADRINPVSRNLMAFYPVPNRPGQANNYIVTANQPGSWDSLAFKVDHRLSSKDTLSVRALERFNNGTSVFKGSTIPGFGSTSDQRNPLYGVSYTRVFTPALINEVRASATRTRYLEIGAHGGQDWVAKLGMPTITTDPDLMGFPAFTVTGLLPLGDYSRLPSKYASTNYQLGDTVTWVKGRHMMKFGGDILHTQFYQPLTGSALGTYQFLDRWTNTGFGDFLLGLLNYVNISVARSPSYLRSMYYGAFVQDDYKISSRLTLNLGLRYDLIKPLSDKYGRLSNFMPEYGKIIVADDRTIPNLEELVNATGLKGMVAMASDYGIPKTLTYASHRNFAPRFGFAWRPFSGARTVVRGGYGIFYASTQMDPIRQDLPNMYPFQIATTFQRQTNNPLMLTLQNPFPSSRLVLYGVSNAAGYELRPGPQYLQSWNMTMEQEIGRGSALEIAYAGSKGTHLSRRYDINQPFYTPATKGNLRPYAGITTINYYSFGSNSTYNAGMLTFRKRFAKGFFYRVNYVYSKSIDNASQVTSKSAGGYQDAQNVRNLRSERGRSDWDIGHAFTVSFSYELPLRQNWWWRGWQLSGSGRMYTGMPFTPQVSGADLNNGEANRPDRIAQGRLDVRTPEKWFDKTAFVPVPLGAYRYGNSGRGILDGPGFVGLNLGLSKRFQIREKDYLQLRCESFNVTNHTNFRTPNVNVNIIDGATITGANAPRQIQLALRYQF